MTDFTAVDAHLVAAWAERVLNPARPVLRIPGTRPTDDERVALGAGFAQIRAAVLGEHVPEVPAGPAGDPSTDVERYLRGIAAGIEATGADREPMSLVAGLVAGAAALQFSRAGHGGVESNAAELAARAGVAAADLATEGAGLSRIAEAAAGVAGAVWTPQAPPDPASADDARLCSLIATVLAALAQVVGRGAPTTVVAGCGAGPGDHSGRRFLAEVTFQFHGDALARDRLEQTLAAMGTDLRVWPVEDRAHYHLHTVHPADVVAEIYALGTPFDLRIGTLEPPLSVSHARMDDGPQE